MRPLHKLSIIALVVAFSLPQLAQADGPAGWRTQFNQARTRPVRSNARKMGKKLFKKAKAFAEREGLPHFVEPMRNGQERLVMNVHGNEKVARYTQEFGKEAKVLENFFNASPSSKPGWSYHRIGERSWEQYGRGETYRTRIGYGSRLAFPYMVSEKEMNDHIRDLETMPNPRFDTTPPHMGGLLSGRFLRNCTDWVTAFTGKFMGMHPTVAVVSHAGQLYDGRVGERMTVKAVMTSSEMSDFTPEALRKNW